jgi:hypothetical protein
MNANVTEATLALIKTSLQNPSESLRKTISTGTGLVPFDLQAPAKNLYPVATPLRNVIPRVGGGVGTATNWKVISNITGSGYDSMGWVPEGQRTGRMSYAPSSKSAAYKTLGEEDNVTFEAINAGRTFEDVAATGVMRILQKMMLKEENAILGGNNGVALGTPGTITVSSSSGGAIAAGTYNVYVVGLTYEGYRNWIAGGSLIVNGVPTNQTVSGADGSTYAINGGSSAKGSPTSTGALSGSNVITASVPAITGALAYAWYVGTVGNETLQAVTTINSVSLASLASTGQNASAIIADNSRNALAFDGLLYSAFESGSGAYVNQLATGTAGVGTYLTSSGRGSINEIDNMLVSMWQNYQTSPDVIYCNAQEIKNITSKVLSSGSGPLLRYNSGGDDPYALVANGTVDFYFNPFALDGGVKIPVKIHPLLPPGTIVCWTNQLPAQYQNNETPNVAEMKIRADYYSLEWPLRTRAREYGVYAEETLAVYFPASMGIITNIANG